MGMFPLFLKRIADVMAPRFSGGFRRADCSSGLLETGTQLKGPPSSSLANYRPISITSVLSKVFERQVSVRLGRFMESSGVLPSTQVAYR